MRFAAKIRLLRRALPAKSRSPWLKTRNEIIRVGVLHRGAFRLGTSHRITLGNPFSFISPAHLDTTTKER
jgi:hypothetical protein